MPRYRITEHQTGWQTLENFVDAKDIATHWPTYKKAANKIGLKPSYNKWRVGRSVLITSSNSEAAATSLLLVVLLG